jgi:hypothetical protein
MPLTEFAFKEKYRYQNGFGSYHEYNTLSTTVYKLANAIPELKQ